MLGYLQDYLLKKMIKKQIKLPQNIIEVKLVNLSKKITNNTTNILLLGQPGSGKSTLLSFLTNNKFEINISPATDTTDWNSEKITLYSIDKYIYIDSPGYDTSKHNVDSYIKYMPFDKFTYIFYIVNSKIQETDEKLFNRLSNINNFDNKFILLRSFADTLNEKDRQEIQKDINNRFNINNIFFISNKTSEGISEIKNRICKL